MDKLVFLAVAAVAIIFGVFIYKYPQKTFEIQKRFYAWINWNIEPISLEKEIRNTKIMGVSLIVFVILAGIYMLFCQCV